MEIDKQEMIELIKAHRNLWPDDDRSDENLECEFVNIICD